MPRFQSPAMPRFRSLAMPRFQSPPRPPLRSPARPRRRPLAPIPRRRRPMSQPDFTVEISQNEYLAVGGEDVNAIITVTAPAEGLAASSANTNGAEIIIVDCSGSMRSPRTKIEQARAATAAAIDVIRDGVAFAVVAGTEKAVPIFPLDYGLAVADDQTRFLAKQAVSGVLPRGGTAIGQWLRLAHTMFGTHPAALRHAILLTDGQNAHETPEQLDEAIRLCEGVF